ncbi:hypothetical protein LCGC14_2611930, partial [marine sediment metagenome]
MRSTLTLPEPVKGLLQRRFGGPKHTALKRGDCWATAVCSYAGMFPFERNELQRRMVLSDLALERAGKDPNVLHNWWQVTARFLREHHLPYLAVVSSEAVSPKYVYIASGGSPRGGFDHSTLAYG